MLNLSGIMVLFMVLFSSSDLFAQPQDVQVVVSEFKQIDSNQDGFIVPQEMQVYQAQAFKELDKDGNYDIDSKELESDTIGMHKLADSDQDGKVTHRESSLKFNEYFEQMDKNQDGKISEAEYTDYWKLIYKF
jgi:Ca2+-binding EF-hand superfamily protein